MQNDVNQGYGTGYGTQRNMMRQPTQLPTNALSRFSSDVFLWGAGLSILISLGLRLSGRRDDSLFVGEWAPTLATLGVMTRLLAR